MARPEAFKRICKKPKYIEFCPKNNEVITETILTVTEYEVLRLIDYEKITQEECAEFMNVGRTTITKTYEDARYKLISSIINGTKLKICGGNYILCNGNNNYCYKKKCKCSEFKENHKGGNEMIIAVTYDNGKVFGHFGHTENFKLYKIEEGKITHEEILSTNGQGHGALAEFLSNLQVDVLICGGIGRGAQIALNEIGIKIIGGVSGNSDEVIKSYLNNELEFTENPTCNHHEGEHNCGEHNCKDHK